MLRLIGGLVVVLAVAATPTNGIGARVVQPACSAAQVRYTPYPGRGFSGIPWIRAEPGSFGLVGLLWYWPPSWRAAGVSEARVYTGGATPDGISTKILWAYLGREAKSHAGYRHIVTGRRLDGPGRTWQHFSPISYAGQNGAPSFASIIRIPTAGCWRLTMTSGRLRGTVVVRAVDVPAGGA